MPTLRAVLPKGDAQTVPFVEVPLLRGSEGPNILRDWMRSKAKSLTAAQWAAVDLAIPSSCALEMTARRAAGMARSPARPGIVNMKTAVTQVTPSFCTVHGAWVPVRGAAV